MIIGLLEAETLPTQVANQFGSYGDMFAGLLQPLEQQPSFRYYATDQGELPGEVSECDAYVVTGSRHNAYDSDPWIEALKDFIRRLHEQRKKCLGICFGHQVIAEALGGKTTKSDKGWGVGLANFTVCERPPWMRNSTKHFNILISHQDQVSALPPSAVRFARNDFCPEGGYSIGSHIFCLQGHPEFSKEYVQFLINKRRAKIGEARSSKAEKALDLPVRRELFQNWLEDFLTA